MLKFFWGTVGSGKSLRILETYLNLKRNKKKENVILVKPKKDNRTQGVFTRFGNIQIDADYILSDNFYDLKDFEIFSSKCSDILVDEVQFMQPQAIELLRKLANSANVSCWGLRNDFNKKPWDSISLLLNLADEIEEIPSTCAMCFENKASFNIRLEEKSEDTGFHYLGVCNGCYIKFMDKSPQL